MAPLVVFVKALDSFLDATFGKRSERDRMRKKREEIKRVTLAEESSPTEINFDKSIWRSANLATLESMGRTEKMGENKISRLIAEKNMAAFTKYIRI